MAIGLDTGSVTVTRNVSVQPDAALIAAYRGSDFTVGQNLAVHCDSQDAPFGSPAFAAYVDNVLGAPPLRDARG